MLINGKKIISLKMGSISKIDGDGTHPASEKLKKVETSKKNSAGTKKLKELDCSRNKTRVLKQHNSE